MKSIKTDKEYKDYVKDKQPKQTLLKNCINAFIWGGSICIFGQLLFDMSKKHLELNEKDAATVQIIILIFIGAFLTSVGIYDKIGKHAGAGSIVPITGFANSIVAPAMEYKKEGYVMGVGAKMFSLAGPVLVYGTSASVIVGIIYYFFK
ncbi:stage V sporulation protein AC [Alkalibaculum sp. M08DMB]|uniref:Stage V sporulation protein AC n=1 Tax=Alkalibaculum sporogenes TaxID=2655001 RepID=A0A6A7KBF1_9FIRM|nr:stage V sporulation protein AC [Alkalibaculum sporogenes]MPW26333.1 stage V sporulation protein AC [Alkalibaculum sporogenes]